MRRRVLSFALITVGISGCATMGAMVGVDREAAYMEGQRQRAEYEATVYGAMNAQSQQRMIEKLRSAWEDIGFSPDEAFAIASAYEYTAAEEAVIQGVRQKGLEFVPIDIKNALNGHNYLLANQLLIASETIRQERSR